jgi:hypothetical protein
VQDVLRALARHMDLARAEEAALLPPPESWRP